MAKNFRITWANNVGNLVNVWFAINSGVLSGPPATFAEVVDAINSGNPGSGSEIGPTAGGGSVVLNCNEFILFGGDPLDGTYSFAGLPAGFKPGSDIKISMGVGGTGSGALTFTGQIQSATAGNSAIQTGVGTISLVYPGSPTALELYTDIVTLVGTDAGGRTPVFFHPTLFPSFDYIQINGSYTIENFTATLDNTSQPVQTGTVVKVTSDPLDPDHMKLDELTKLTVTYKDPNTTIDVLPDLLPAPTEFELFFTIPSIIADAPQILYIAAVGNGTQFSGSVSLGKLETIYFRNAPGIYRLVKDKTSDTLYDVINGGTIEVQIPDPNFKTGFIGG